MTKTFGLTAILLPLFASTLCAALSAPLKEIIPAGTPEEVDTFLANVSSRATNEEQRMLRNALMWMEDFFVEKPNGINTTPKEEFYEFLRGSTGIDVVLHGYIHRNRKLQDLIDETYGKRLRILAQLRDAETPQERAKLESEAERLQESLELLVKDRDQTAEEAKLVTAPPPGVIPTPPGR